MLCKAGSYEKEKVAKQIFKMASRDRFKSSRSAKKTRADVMEKYIRGKTLCVNIDWTTTTWTMLILSVSVIPVYIMQMFLFAVLLNKSGLDLTCCGIFNWSSVLYRFDCAYLHTKRIEMSWRSLTRPKVSQHVSPKVEIWIFVLGHARSLISNMNLVSKSLP